MNTSTCRRTSVRRSRLLNSAAPHQPRRRWRPGILTSLTLVALLLAPTSVHPQTAQRFSIQVSPIYRVLAGDVSDAGVDDGFGGEAQIRFTPGVISVGLGVEYSRHDLELSPGVPAGDTDLLGGFFEPRYVVGLGNDVIVLYLSARVALSRLSTSVDPGTVGGTTFDGGHGEATGYTANGGGGFLLRLGSSVNLDVGATYGVTDWGQIDTATGDAPIDLGTGRNFVARIGLAIGIAG